MQPDDKPSRPIIPWVTIVLAVVSILNPLGSAVLEQAFMSNEQLSRNIAQPLILVAAIVLLIIGGIEYLIRRARRKRPAKNDAL